MKKVIIVFITIIVLVCAVGCANKTSETTQSNKNSLQTSVISSKANSLNSTNNSNSTTEKPTNSTTEKPTNSTTENTANSQISEKYSSQSEKIEIEKITNGFSIYRDGKIDRSAISLPRVSDSGLVYISWQSSNEKIINNYGLVFQNNFEQSVTLTATFTYGNSYKKVNYNLTVLKKSVSPIITKSDERIIKSVNVSTVSELQSAFSSAKAGDAIIIEDGVYNNFAKKLSASGTISNPIIIMAKNNGKAIFSGITQIEITGNNVIVCGLNFKNGSPANDKGAVVFRGDNLRLTESLFYAFEKTGNNYKWLSLYGSDNEVDHNEFDSKTVGGALMTVWRDTPTAQYHYIHDNIFKNYSKGSGNGFETIRLGDSEFSQSNSYSLIENNLFQNLNGEIEIVSVKSGRNAFIGNTFKECSGLLSLRHGKNNLAANNVFLCNNIAESGGIRMYDGGHVVYNNYVENSNSTSDSRGGIVIHSGVNKIAEIPTVINLQWTSYNCYIQSNTTVGCVQSYIFGGIKDEIKCQPVDLVVNDNFTLSSGTAITFEQETNFKNCSNNIVYAKKLSNSTSTVNGFNYFSGTVSPEKTINGVKEFSLGAKNLTVVTEANAGNTIKIVR